MQPVHKLTTSAMRKERKESKMNQERIYPVVAVLTIALSASAVLAAPTIDGIIGPFDADGLPDGYQVHAWLTPTGDAAGLPKGDVFLLQESTDLYMAFIVPLDFVDNTYGPNQSPTWGAEPHPFDKLLASDKLEIKATYGGGSEIKEKVEYIELVGTKYEALVKADHATGLVTAEASSLEYNLNVVAPVTIPPGPEPINSPPLVGDYPAAPWVSEVIYEVCIDLSAVPGYTAAGSPIVLDLDDGGFVSAFSLTLTDLHASPNKAGKDHSFSDEVPDEFTPIQPIPAPGALVMGAMGLGMVGWMKKRFVSTDK